MSGEPAVSQSTESVKHTLDSAETTEQPIAATNGDANDGEAQPPLKKVRVDATDAEVLPTRQREHGKAPVKEEFLIPLGTKAALPDDDAAEGREEANGDRRKTKSSGQNKARHFGSSRDKFSLCNTVANSNEFSPRPCRFGDRCNMSHDLRKYLKDGKREDLTTFNGKCPLWEDTGRCYMGWKCRFAGSHSEEVTLEDGRKELRLLQTPGDDSNADADEEHAPMGIVNVVTTKDKFDLHKRRFDFKRADKYADWLTKDAVTMEKAHNGGKDAAADHRAAFVDPPFLPSEKRRLYFGPETPALAPLTTQGNLPFRRLCVELGAQLTYSEMAVSMPLIQGGKSEWALLKAYESEAQAPLYTPTADRVVEGYDHSKDVRFGAQISANKPWIALKATEALSRLVPHLRVIDLNCGCPIDLIYQSGAGSALLDTPSKLEKMIRGMNAVSDAVPISAKIRMGTRDDHPTALKLIERLTLGGIETRDRLGAPGCAAITLHGRSRQQRYTKNANWSYIAEAAALIAQYNAARAAQTDTARAPDDRTLPNGGRVWFLGNGDCYSHLDHAAHIADAQVDSVMVGRGALVKPWLFEEIATGQYLDKSAAERLAYVEKFARYGLAAWGADEIGVGQTRRFLLEWLSFAHRYVPLGILEYLPPSLQDRPPAFRGRNELETLLSSDNYKDWIKISEMFLGPAHKDFKFAPKHKSNSYEIEAEG